MREWEEMGGAAFTVPLDYDDEGITKRDYFAAKAMPAIMQAYLDEDTALAMTTPVIADVARMSYLFADAMLKARRQ